MCRFFDFSMMLLLGDLYVDYIEYICIHDSKIIRTNTLSWAKFLLRKRSVIIWITCKLTEPKSLPSICSINSSYLVNDRKFRNWTNTWFTSGIVHGYKTNPHIFRKQSTSSNYSSHAGYSSLERSVAVIFLHICVG